MVFTYCSVLSAEQGGACIGKKQAPVRCSVTHDFEDDYIFWCLSLMQRTANMQASHYSVYWFALLSLLWIKRRFAFSNHLLSVAAQKQTSVSPPITSVVFRLRSVTLSSNFCSVFLLCFQDMLLNRMQVHWQVFVTCSPSSSAECL